MPKVVVTDYAFNDLEIEKGILEPEGLELVGQKEFEGQDKLIELTSDADYVITQFAPVNADVIGAMQNAKIIVRYGIGVDNVDLKAATDKNIPVCNVPDFCVDEVADHALAMILTATRQLVPNWDVIRNGEWKLAVGLEDMRVLRELTVGVVAYGKIGKEVALRLRGFKCRVLVFDPIVDDSVIQADGFIPATLDEIYAQSDVISLHCPSNAKTDYMINAESTGKMKKGVILVNTSRGTLVKTDDMIAALQNGQISFAAMDVLDPEPINPDSPLLKMGNVIINAHIASTSASAVLYLRESAAKAVLCAHRGEKLANVVNGVGG